MSAHQKSECEALNHPGDTSPVPPASPQTEEDHSRASHRQIGRTHSTENKVALPSDRQTDRMQVTEKKLGGAEGVGLSCSVMEENRERGESYSADWHSVELKTRPQDSQTVSATDESRRESFWRQWETRPLVQGCPSGVVRLGAVEQGVREHQQLPYRNTLPLPIFTPAELGLRLGRGAPHGPEDLRPFPTPDGSCPVKRAVGDIVKDLPPAKPIRMEFAKGARSLGRSMSQEAQRG
ncbi:hypothetical protein SKAU_G00118890 [Synaphobranchus kaupii]|uniref:Telethonin n=1 Tax=Synaphobranchus kaupii TaxID=118154 RepID=A0A9Q1FNB8_SYNKA|nr:hypothetical protein SKAU_G00118890 [Synaphobranchus kaupii]